MVGASSGHGILRIFTLFKTLEEFPLETSNVVDQEKMVKGLELILENVFGRVLPNCAKGSLSLLIMNIW